MLLKVDGTTYWASIVKERKNARDFELNIGNPNGRPKPCMRLTLYKNKDNTYDVVIQDIKYYATCSSPQLMQRKSGTIKMAKGALKALLSYCRINAITFSDESNFEHKTHGAIPLPEKFALAGRPTWYQQHFGAIPSNDATRNVLEAYQDASKLLVSETKIVNERVYRPTFAKMTIAQMMRTIGNDITEADISSILHALKLEPLSGSSWEIPPSVVATYDVGEAMFDENGMMGGGEVFETRRRQRYSFRKNHRAYLEKRYKDSDE